jgi:hypothetical protein
MVLKLDQLHHVNVAQLGPKYKDGQVAIKKEERQTNNHLQ